MISPQSLHFALFFTYIPYVDLLYQVKICHAIRLPYMLDPFSPKQIQFIRDSNAKYNLAHGAVRSGKTVATLFRFMKEVIHCPSNSIFILGYSLSTIYRNVISLLFDSEELKFFSPYCSWSKGEHVLSFGEKKVKCLGAGDEGALGIIQGLTIDLCLCDEITLYPDNVIDMIDTRLSRAHSKLFASMNPRQPDHKVKKWIDKAEAGDPLYYSLHWVIEDNIFLPSDYKSNLKDNLKGLFYKRNYLGLWCMAEGAVYDFFDRKIHVVSRPPTAAQYYICGIDYGTSGVFAAVLVGINTGRSTQSGKKMWVEKEYYWDVKQTNRQKTNSEFLRDMQQFLEGYGAKVYMDPSASSMKLEMRRASIPVIDADNDVLEGIRVVASLMAEGTLSIMNTCTNLIREIEGYVWDERKAKMGEDAPLKRDDHACFAAGTLVDGVPIEEIDLGDEVTTRNGLKRVVGIHKSLSTCFEYEIAGRKMICTPCHPFFTLNSGWKSCEDLMQSDILITTHEELWESSENPSLLSGTAESIDAIQTLQMNLKECILSAEVDICIEIYGHPKTVPFPEDSIFITSTKTRLTMIYPISNAYLLSSMQKDIQKIINAAFRTNVGRLLLIGIDLSGAGMAQTTRSSTGIWKVGL